MKLCHPKRRKCRKNQQERPKCWSPKREKFKTAKAFKLPIIGAGAAGGKEQPKKLLKTTTWKSRSVFPSRRKKTTTRQSVAPIRRLKKSATKLRIPWLI